LLWVEIVVRVRVGRLLTNYKRHVAEWDENEVLEEDPHVKVAVETVAFS
jgi:hypothetical protein